MPLAGGVAQASSSIVQIDPERLVRGFGAGDALENQIHRSAAPHRFHLRRDVREDTCLRRDLQRFPNLIE